MIRVWVLATSIIIHHVWSMALPPTLEKAMENGLLTRPRPDTYVLGTVHIGSESAKEARLLIDWCRPSVVVLEASPSRIKRIRKRTETEKLDKKSNIFKSITALADCGWASGGLKGLIFSVAVLGGSLIKQSFSAKEEDEILPRIDEFDAALQAAQLVNADVIAADYEIEELIKVVSLRMSLVELIDLAVSSFAQDLGIQKPDPIRRIENESIISWASRRRKIETARASRKYGEEKFPEFSKILVDERDDTFTKSCVEASSNDGASILCCIVGLVHLDGVTKRLQEDPMV